MPVSTCSFPAGTVQVGVAFPGRSAQIGFSAAAGAAVRSLDRKSAPPGLTQSTVAPPLVRRNSLLQRRARMCAISDSGRSAAMRLSYAIKYVADMARAIAFHRDVLGLPLKFQSPEWSEFATGQTTLALHA